MLEHIIEFDTNLFLYLNNLGTKPWDHFWLFISNKLSWIPLYAILLFYLYQTHGIKKTILAVTLVALMILFTDQITNLLKNDFVKRLRPCFTEEILPKFRLVKKTCGGKYGFTSAHASNHFALAVFLGRIFYSQAKWILYSLIIWATIIAFSRVYIGVHFPLDIICGSFIGILFGIIFHWFYRAIQYQFPYFISKSK